MSFVSFTGLVGVRQRGTGLHLDHRYENVCANRFEGTDISGSDIGVLVDDAVALVGGERPTVKSDTNHFWFSYIRMCNTCVWERATGVDCGSWNFYVDASLTGSTAIRSSAMQSQWDIIMGCWNRDNTYALVLDPGAENHIITMRPPLEDFRWRDDSGVRSNVFLGARRVPEPNCL